ncbi:transposase [Paenibacillaceae bacterium WGS1546]|uniref:transposase n=1 Tax=Cohnella sp. WGS1546 TaxID=3366810 RepID=UPI00372D6F9B
MEKLYAFYLEPSNEDACIQLLYDARWPNGFQCPSCGHDKAGTIRTRRLPLYECRSCGVQTSLISGTIMQGGRTPIRLWLLAIELHAMPEGVTATRLAEIIGTTYKTAWLICHKIRHAMSQADRSELLSGLVRINFAQYGRPYNPTVYRHPQEQPLLIGASLNHEGQFTHIKIKQAIEECFFPEHTCPLNKEPFIRKHVHPAATEIIAVTLKYSKDRNRQLLQICRDASDWINGQFKGIGPKHLQAYLDQYAFGYNQISRRETVYPYLLRLCASIRTTTYPDLTRKPNLQPRLRAQYNHLLKHAC